MGSRPSVSVVITTFNQVEFLKAAIESVLGQTLLPQELIVIDDASTDATPEVMEDFARQNVCVRYVRLPDNRGMQFTAQYGLKQARGTHVAYLNHDDVWLPRHLEVLVGALERHSGNVMAFGRYRVIDERSRVLVKEVREPLPSSSMLESLLLKRIIVQAPRAVYRRQAALDVGGITHWTGDWVLNCLLAARYPNGIVQVPECTIAFRMHSEQSYTRTEELRAALLEASDYICDRLSPAQQMLRPRVKAICHLHSAIAFWQSGKWVQAWRCLCTALATDPLCATTSDFRAAAPRTMIPPLAGCLVRRMKRTIQLWKNGWKQDRNGALYKHQQHQFAK